MAAKHRLDWRLFAIVYAVVAAAFAARALFNADTIPLIADTDDAMRLVVVRDLLAGQGWYDNVQHRMNAPFGAELHWSRLADLPLAALLLILRPLLGNTAETVAAYVLPLLWLGGLLYLSGRISVRLVGPEGLLPGLALPAMSLSVMSEFSPGRIDHHSLQILLVMAMLWGAIEALSRPRIAILAGLAAATSLALGIEALPSVVAAIIAFGLIWVLMPERMAAVRGFGFSLGLGTLVHLLIALPPDRWLVPVCDAISIVYAASALAAGAVLVALTMLPLQRASLWLRLGLGLGSGAAALAILAVTFPDCLRGPYAALDPVLVATWIDAITEALPLWTALAEDPVYPLAVAVPTALAVLVTGWQLWRGDVARRPMWLIYAVFLLLAVVAMLIQIRASRMATPLAVPAGAWLIVAARNRYLASQTIPRVMLLLLSWIGSAGIAVAVMAMGIKALASPEAAPTPTATTEQTVLTDRRQCVMPAAFDTLAAIPPERVMTPIDLGSHILAFTPHHVVGAPYHRNEAGVRDALAFFNGPIEDGYAILERRGVSLIIICDALPEMRGRADASPESFTRLLERGALPEWIVETTPAGETLRVFAVLPRAPG